MYQGWHYIAACLASETLHCGVASAAPTNRGGWTGGAGREGGGLGRVEQKCCRTLNTTILYDHPVQRSPTHHRYLPSDTDSRLAVSWIEAKQTKTVRVRRERENVRACVCEREIEKVERERMKDERTNTERKRARERERHTQRTSARPREPSRGKGVRAKRTRGGDREGETGVVRAKGWVVFSLLGKRRQRRKGEVQGKRGESERRSESSRSSTSPTLHNTVRLPSTASIDWTPYCLR